MTLRVFRRKVAYISFFLLGGVVVIMQVINSLQIQGEEDGLLVGQTVASLRRVEQEMELQKSRWYVDSWLRRTQQGEEGAGEKKREGQGEDIELREVRMARELHDLRIDRLNNFAKRTGSLLADQQQRNLELRRNGLPVPEAALQQQQRAIDEQKSSLWDKWNVSHIVESLSIENRDEALRLENKLREELHRFYDVYTAKEGEEQNNLHKELKDDVNDLKQERKGQEEEEEDYENEGEEGEGKNRVFDPEDFNISIAEDGKVIVTRKQLEPEVLVENLTRTATEIEEWKVMLTLRTTLSNHKKRLPLLFDTWITKVNSSQVFLVTDGDDPFTRLMASVKGIHYVNAKCGNSYIREQLCCKAGAELQLMFQEQNKAFDWICHVDDDMYVNMKNLVALLSHFNPRLEPIYLGRSGSPWYKPRRIKSKSRLGRPGAKYHFAVGGMYCLSRAMLDKTMKWLVGGEAFSESCSLTEEPEDVTVGLIVALLNYSLSRTERINTHGLHLATTVHPYTLTEQVAISYGYGSVKWGVDPYNAVYVPDALFTLDEDESQFRSLHCLLYPSTSWCRHQREMAERRRDLIIEDYANYVDDM